jgi:hypothetical protein
MACRCYCCLPPGFEPRFEPPKLLCYCLLRPLPPMLPPMLPLLLAAAPPDPLSCLPWVRLDIMAFIVMPFSCTMPPYGM